MRIDQSNTIDAGTLNVAAGHKEEVKNQSGNTAVVTIEKSRKADALLQQATYGKPEKEGGTSLEDIEQQASDMNATQMKNEMLFAADTTSAKDAAAMDEDGFSLHNTDVHTVVTETDKMKMMLAKAGKDTSYFGDDLSEEQLEALSGSQAMAQQLTAAVEQADLPVSEDAISGLSETASMMQELTPVSEGAAKYMLDNELPVTTANLYKAEFSGSASYAAASNTSIDYQALQGQMEEVIAESGMDVTEESLSQCKWLLDNEIPLTAENLIQLQQLSDLALPMGTEDLLGAVIPAMQEGIAPQNAVLTGNKNLTAQATEAVTTLENVTDEELAYCIQSGQELTIENLREAKKALEAAGGNQGTTVQGAADSNQNAAYTSQGLDLLTAKRQLEETRLMMSTEANLTLLKKGISIDTVSLSELVENLKAQENAYYENLLSGEGIPATEDNIAIFRNTTKLVSELQTMPAYAIGMQTAEEATLESLYQNGQEMQKTLQDAGQSYETMMTTPRSDLGDSISKAFRNIDDILTDLSLDITKSNQRAIRILAYNQMEITPDAIEQVKAVDEEVQRVFSNLKPAVVREMIKDGTNPLDMSLGELNAAAEQIQEEQGSANEDKFSKYLWQLEQNQEISEEERSAYIGVYRLIRQVEKTDGAAIGSLMQQGAPITMRNLLTQVRSAKHEQMDYTVDDDFGGVDAAQADTQSITEQIAAGYRYQKNRVHDVMDSLTPQVAEILVKQENWLDMTPEQLAEQLAQTQQEQQTKESEAVSQSFYEQQVQALQEAAKAPEEVYELLDRYDMPATVDHILAASNYMKDRNSVFHQLFEYDENQSDTDWGKQIDAIKEDILEAFGEAVKTPEEMAEAQHKLAETAEQVMKSMIDDAEHITSLDIRQMKLANTQVALGTAAAKEEHYAIPVLVEGKMCNVSLKIVRGTEQKGLVDVAFETEQSGKVAAELRATEDGVTGYIASDSKETLEQLAGKEAVLRDQLGLTEEQQLAISYVESSHLNLQEFSEATRSAQTKPAQAKGNVQAGDGKSSQVQTSTLYRMAESFLKMVKSQNP